MVANVVRADFLALLEPDEGPLQVLGISASDAFTGAVGIGVGRLSLMKSIRKDTNPTMIADMK
jgi:hypothetical protein